MSWLFGYSTKPPQPPNPPDLSTIIPDPNTRLSKAEKKVMDAYRFDSSALERATQAVRELEKSIHFKDFLELSKLQEQTKQYEYQVKVKEYEALIEQSKEEQMRIDHEERRKTLTEETKQHQMRAQLSKKSYKEQLSMQQRVYEENIREQEESVAKQEAMRKATITHEMELRERKTMKLLEVLPQITSFYCALVKAKARAEGENREITLEQIRIKAQEQRTIVLESIKTMGSDFGAGMNALITDWDKILAAAAGLSLFALGVYTASVRARYIEARIGKPFLVVDTSRFSFADAVWKPGTLFKRAVEVMKGKKGDALAGVILEPSLEQRLRDVAIATRNTQKNKGFYQNFLMYGPRGTGKKLFAKKLAKHSGMDYAIITGSDVGPMGKDAVAAIHKVFNWAQTSRKGVLLFIDEADAFLRNRASERPSEELRSALHAFLYHSSERSKRFMLVLASNMPYQLDSAIYDRLHKIIEFELPGVKERERLIRLYFDKFVLQPASEGRLRVDQFDYGALCSLTAKSTEGFSGRALSELGVAWQSATYASEDGRLTSQMAEDICKQAIKEHKQKVYVD